jgi:hypothetical protein
MDNVVDAFIGAMIAIIIGVGVLIATASTIITPMTQTSTGLTNFTGNGTVACTTSGCIFLSLDRTYNSTANLTSGTDFNFTQVNRTSGIANSSAGGWAQDHNFSFTYGNASYVTNATSRILLNLIPLLLVIAIIMGIIALILLKRQ